MREKLSMEQLGRMSVEEFKTSNKFPFIIIADNIRSMSNIGSIFRTSDAFRIEKIYLCGITPCPPHREIQKTALGATESVAWEYVESTQTIVKQLKEEGWTLLSLEQTTNSVMLDELKLEKNTKIAIVLGNEVDGAYPEANSYGVYEYAAFWTADTDEDGMAYYRYLICDQSDMMISKGDPEAFGASVRCVRDAVSE
jgi:tRNA G18 (ribose-2'-O)-methylase SpoU